jgi:5-formyltetrahydrofolate cyclo-ligase
MMDKKKANLKVRLNMSADEIATKSQAICRQLLKEVNWQNISTVSAYRPIAELNEVDISPLLGRLKSRYPQITVRLVSQAKDQELPPERFDLILVPTLAFDTDNYRLGWGGGFYDKFLAAQPQALKIGVGYRNGFCKEGLPCEPHDIPLDKIMTEVK